MVSVVLDQSVSMAAVRLELPLDKQVKSLISWLWIWAKMFEGRLALNLGLNLTLVSLSCAQKHFFG